MAPDVVGYRSLLIPFSDASGMRSYGPSLTSATNPTNWWERRGLFDES
jgi:hypothetical protein